LKILLSSLRALICVLILACCFPLGLLAQSGNGGPKVHAPVFVEVRLDSPVEFSRLKAGDVLRGEATRNVFSGYHVMIPAGSRVSLRVSGMEKRRKESSDKWPWPAEHFRSKNEKFPTFDLLTVSLPGGGNTSFPVSLVTACNIIHVVAQASKTRKSKDRSQAPSTGEHQDNGGKPAPGSWLEMAIETDGPAGGSTPSTGTDSPSGNGPLTGIETLAAGTETKLALLKRLSASKSRPGDSFKAILAEPLRLSSGEIVPEGSLFEGRVRKSTAPRWLSRPGSLYLTFDRLVLPTGASLPIAASVVGVETKRDSRMKVDSEGGLSGGSPGKKRLLIDLGVGFGFAKIADDSFQLIAEALVPTATDASTAGTARLIGMAVGGVFFIKRRGRDVVLPLYTMIDIRFDRSPAFPTPETQRQGMR
jgi:hypothetical protein